MKVICEVKKCIGCGGCIAVCPECWEFGDDGKTKLIGGTKNSEGNWEKEISEAGCHKDAEDGCPAQCIHIVE